MRNPLCPPDARAGARSALGPSATGHRARERPTAPFAADAKVRFSFGVAGGLVPGLQPGTCVVGSVILSANSRLPTDRPWSQKLLNTIPGAIYGPLFGVPAPITDPEAK